MRPYTPRRRCFPACAPDSVSFAFAAHVDMIENQIDMFERSLRYKGPARH